MSKFADYGRSHAVLVDDDELAQVCRDLPDSACREQLIYDQWSERLTYL